MEHDSSSSENYIAPSVWEEQCRLCWERLEWRAWPDSQTQIIVDQMVEAWKNLPEDRRKACWGQPLTPAIHAAWLTGIGQH